MASISLETGEVNGRVTVYILIPFYPRISTLIDPS